MIWIAAAVWLLCGFAHYGLWVGYFQTEYELIADETLRSDRLFGAFTILGGPVSLLATLIVCHPFSWKL